MNKQTLKPGWKRWRFDQMAISVNDRIDNPAEADVEHYVGLEHLDTDSLKIRRWGVPTDVEATKLRFRKGDIIFGRRRAYQRKLAVADFDGICSAHAMVLRAKTDVVLPEFLPFFMQSDLFMNRALEISVGSLSPTINWKTLAAQEFALPPMKEQWRINDLFGTAEQVYQCAVEFSTAAKTCHRAFVDDVISKGAQQQKFEKVPPKLLEGWSYVTIEDLCDQIVDCLHRTPKYQDAGYPAIRTEDVEEGILHWQSAQCISEEEYKIQINRLKPIAGDIFFSREGERMGIAAQVPPGVELCLSQRMLHLRAKRDFPANLIMEYLNSSWVKRQISMYTSGSTSPHLNVKDVRTFQVPVPPKQTLLKFAEQSQQLLDGYFSALSHVKQAKAMRDNLREYLIVQG